MSLFVPFATGFLNTYTDVKRDQAKAEIDKKAAQKKQTFEIGKLILQNADKLGGVDTAALTTAFQEEDLPKIASLVTSMQETGSTQPYGTGPDPYKLNLLSEMKYGSGMSAFDRAEVFWQSWQNQLADEYKYNEALDYFKNDRDAANALRADVLKNEYEIRMGNILRQKKQGVEAVGMQFIDLGSDYGNAARLFDELGFQSVEEDTISQAATYIQDLDTETQTAFWMNTKNKDGGGVEQAVAISVDKTTASIWEQMAAAGGFANAQEMIFSYNYDPSIVREEGETDQQFAAKQNALLYKKQHLLVPLTPYQNRLFSSL